MFDMDAFRTRLRAFTRTLPEAFEEVVLGDHLTFRVGKKPFVFMGETGDDASCSIKVPLFDQPIYLEDPRFTRTAYIGQHGWVTMDVAAARDWAEIERLVEQSYRLVAQKRLIKVLDARKAQA